MNIVFKYVRYVYVKGICGLLEMIGMVYWVDFIIKGKDIS